MGHLINNGKKKENMFNQDDQWVSREMKHPIVPFWLSYYLGYLGCSKQGYYLSA
jgi:hypothetical protein